MSESNGNIRAKWSVAICVVLVAALLSYWGWGFYSHISNVNKVNAIVAERASKLRVIAMALQEFEKANGRWPDNSEELVEFWPEAKNAIEAPSYSTSQYLIEFALIQTGDPESIIVADPGLDGVDEERLLVGDLSWFDIAPNLARDWTIVLGSKRKDANQ